MCKVRQEWVEAHPDVTLTSSCPNGEGKFYNVESGKNIYDGSLHTSYLETWKEKFADESSTEYHVNFGTSGAGYLANGELSASIEGVGVCACFAGCDNVYFSATNSEPTSLRIFRCCSDWKEVEAEHCQDEETPEGMYYKDLHYGSFIQNK